MTRMTLLLCTAIVCACGQTDQNEGQRMPKLAPPPRVPIPADLSITVEIDGAPAAPIDAARLAGIEPDFQDDERRAWKIATLLGPSIEPLSTRIAVTGRRGVTVELTRSEATRELVPVILLSRRGDVIAALVQATEPFPHYHGQGGRLGRPLDPLPRISDVTSIRVTTRP